MFSLLDRFKDLISGNADQNSSGKPTSDRFAFAPLTSLGFASKPCAVAWDPCQELLAVGTQAGAIHLSSSTVEYTLQHESLTAAPTLIRFKVGDRYIVSVHGSTELRVWNLQTRQPHAFQDGTDAIRLDGSSAITVLEIVPFSTWALVGTEDGTVVSIDIQRGTVSDYVVALPQDASGSAVAIEMCPVDPNVVLIGYQNSLVVLWDLKARETVKRFSYTPPSGASLKCISWRPDGTQFAASYGPILAFWAVKDAGIGGFLKTIKNAATGQIRPISETYVDEPAPKSPPADAPPARSPIHRLWWLPSHNTSNAAETVFVAVGGNSGDPGVTLSLLSKPKDYSEQFDPTANSRTAFIPGQTTTDSVLFPLPENSTQLALIQLTPAGSLRANFIDTLSTLSPSGTIGSIRTLALPPSASLLATSLGPTAYSESSEFLLLEFLSIHRDLSETHETFPGRGGTLLMKNAKQIRDLLFAIDTSSGTLQIWHMSTPTPRKLYAVELEGCFSAPNVEVTDLVVDIEQRAVFVVAGPEAVLLRFVSSLDARKAVERERREEEDVDRLMAEVDAAIDGILETSEEIKALQRGDEELGKVEAAEKELPSAPSEPAPVVLREPTVNETSVVNVTHFAFPRPMNSTRGGWDRAIAIRQRAGRKIVKVAVAAWEGLVAIADEDGRLIVVDSGSGLEVFNDVFEDPKPEAKSPRSPNSSTGTDPSPGGMAAKIHQLHFADTIFNSAMKGTSASLRTCLFVATEMGSVFSLGVFRDETGVFLAKTFLFRPNHTVENPIYLAILDPNGLLVRRQHRGPDSPLPSENYLVAVLSQSVRVYLLDPHSSPERIAKVSFNTSAVGGRIAAATVGYVAGEACVVVATTGGRVAMYALPGLGHVWDSGDSMPIVGSLGAGGDEWVLTRDGRVVVRRSGRDGDVWTHWQMYALNRDTSKYPEYEVKLYDYARQSAWARKEGISGGGLASVSRNKEADELFDGRRQAGPGGSSSNQIANTENVFSNAKNALSERGEKLENLEKKFGDLADASSNFLDMAKALNQKQKKGFFS
ncbi:hypothetical protein BJ742DRAFT_27609 [Cladochytrium replicatum]|nr:hypothetical protein BJ742DRAFT_27609 [Cladochytrium replicatum]